MLYTLEQINDMHGGRWKKDAVEKFADKMSDKDNPFPCIPATQGHQLNRFRYGFVSDPRSDSSVVELSNIMEEYSISYKEIGKYTSLIIFYDTPADLKEGTGVEEFEQLFWKQLSLLSESDKKKWPLDIPEDPHDTMWEYCFHEEKYFIYCATPSHKNRQSRHFPYFMLAVTPRSVLEQFNSNPSNAAKVKSKIRERILNYDSAPIHPDLNTYGKQDNYEWKQYFLHDDDTSLSKCPFHRIMNRKDEKD